MRPTAWIALLSLAALASHARGGPAELGEIRNRIDRGMLRTANARLARFVTAFPESDEGLELLGELRLIEGRYDDAEYVARRALALGVRTASEWILWGRARFEQGRERVRDGEAADVTREWFQQAEYGFRQARETKPDHPDALWRTGLAREWQGYPGTAEQFYDAQIREHPDVPDGYRCLGELRARQAEAGGDARAARALRAEALAVIEKGLEAAGEDAGLLHARAEVLEKVGRRGDAIASWKRAIRADPDLAVAWTRLADRVDRVRELVPFAVEVLRAEPTSCAAARIAGRHAFERDPLRGEKAWTRYEVTLERVLPALRWNGDDEALYLLAFRSASKLLGETPKSAPNARVAVDAFRRIHEAYAWSGDAANNLGYYYREVPDYEACLTWYLRAVERAPRNQDILNDTGLVYLYHRPGEREKGLPYFEKVLDLVIRGDQLPERGYWDALENLTKHYWEVDRRPELVVKYARMRYRTTKGVEPYNQSQVAAGFAEKARRALGH